MGKGQENNPDDVEALDGRLRSIRAYAPPPEYADNPQRYATEPMISALERYQEQHGLKIDGVALPGGPTERAINNRLLAKPRGAGLLYDPPSSLSGTVGCGFENRRSNVAGVQRRLGALGYLPEDPFDKPHGFIDEATANGIKAFQRASGLADDGWLAPGGETERALDDAISDLAGAKRHDWFDFVERAGRAQQAWLKNLSSPPNLGAPIDDADSDVELVPAKTRPQVGAPGSSTGPARLPPALQPRQPRLLEVPGYRPQPDFRRAEPPPRDLQWNAPGQRPQQPIRPRAPQAPPAYETGPVGIDDIDNALRRPSIPDLNSTVTYLPEPGSPLGIPILGARDGRRGKLETRQATNALTTAVEKACKKVMGEEAVVHVTGPGPGGDLKERRYPHNSKEYSYPDSTIEVRYKGFTIVILGDTYTPRGDLSPNSAEAARFAKLDRNMARDDRVFVRLPKPWMFGQEIDLEKLGEFTKELCKEVKKALDEGKVGDGKDKLRIERIFKALTKKKKPEAEGSP